MVSVPQISHQGCGCGRHGAAEGSLLRDYFSDVYSGQFQPCGTPKLILLHKLMQMWEADMAAASGTVVRKMSPVSSMQSVP